MRDCLCQRRCKPRRIDVDLEELQPGDEVLFNDRSVPCVVEAAGDVYLDEGAIFVEYHVVARGPAGAEIWLQRTGTGRHRVKESTPYGAYANVDRLEKIP